MSISNANTSAANINRFQYTATGGETSISGVDSNGATISYIIGKEQVFVNGVLLERTADYTATDGATIALSNALVAGDILEIIAFSAFTVSTAVSAATVANKGDLLVGTSAATVTNLPVGADGSTLVANSSASTGVSWATPSTMANPVINGGFDNWQRGTSIAITYNATFGYTADRFWSSTGFNGTVSRQATGDTTNLPNIQYCARVQRNTGDTNTAAATFVTPLETATTIPFAGKTVTVSFYARAGANYSTSGNGLSFNLITGTGTDQNRFGSYTGEAYPVSGTPTLTTTWQRFAYTGTIASTATEMAVYFRADRTGTAGANDYFDVTGVQIDLGTYTATTAPAFRRSGGTLQGELAACQRYYYREANGSANAIVATAYATSGTIAASYVYLPVQMRAVPTVVDFSTIAFESPGNILTGNITAAVITDKSSVNVASVNVTTSGLTTGQTGWLRYNNSTSAYLGFGAEL